MQHDKGELAGPVDRHEHGQPTLLGPNLREVNVEAANRIAVELTPFWFVVFDIWQALDAVVPEAAVQR
jgi:hypothetical protein